MDEHDLFYPLGDSAVVMTLGPKIDLPTHRRVKKLFEYISSHPFVGLIELVPTYTTLTLYYDPNRLSKDLESSPYYEVCRMLRECLAKLSIEADASGTGADAIAETTTYGDASKGVVPNTDAIITIPVCYDDDFAHDLAFIAKHSGLHRDEVIRLHTGGDYVVNMIGFVPGFPYLAGLSPRIAAPRKKTPSPYIEAGSVGIAGHQTGIYPLRSPGGWQIIGRTPVALFRPFTEPPSLLRFGDAVRFYAISRETYDAWGDV